jgi:toxin FitB
MKYLLDTNVISELIAREPEPQVVAWVDSLDPNFVYLSVITIGEISQGIAKLPPSKRQETLVEWLHNELLIQFRGHILDIDTAVMLTWGQLTAKAKRTLPAIDSLLAAVALHHDCALVTRNEKDFADTGLVVINPWDTE